MTVSVGGGHIKRLFFLTIIFSLFFSFVNIYSADTSGDGKIMSESRYFDEVKTSMGENNKTTNVTDKPKEKINLSKGYWEYIKIVVVLALVVLVIYLIFRFLRKAMKINEDAGEKAVIISSQSLGPGKAIQVIYIATKYLIIGVTNDNINLITEITDPKEIERLELQINNKKTDEGNSFIDILSGIIRGKPKDNVEKKSFDYESDSLDFLKKQKDRIDKINE